MSTTDNKPLQPAANNYSTFKLKTRLNKDWLDWKLSIPN